MDVGVYVDTNLTGGYWGAAAGRQSALPVRCVKDLIGSSERQQTNAVKCLSCFGSQVGW